MNHECKLMQHPLYSHIQITVEKWEMPMLIIDTPVAKIETAIACCPWCSEDLMKYK